MSDFDDEKMEQGVLCKTGHELSRHHQVEKSKAAATRNSGGIAGGWVLD